MTDDTEAGLVAAIVADPDALEPRLVYGDYLQARSDPRGELISVQVGLRARPDDVELLARERTLAAQLSTQLVRDTPLPSFMIARWHLGFVDALRLEPRSIRALRSTHRAWFAQPAFACVREVEIGSKFARNLRVIQHLGLAPTLRTLRFGDLQHPIPEPTLSAIAARLPKLTALHLRCAEVPDLALLRGLPLRELGLETASLGDGAIARVGEAPWPLETLGLRAYDVPADCHPVLATLFTGAQLPTVRHFVLGHSVPVTVAIAALATSGRAATVETVTGDFHRAAHADLVALEPHRAALARVRFLPLLGLSTYYDTEGLVAAGSFLNYRLERPAEAVPYYERALHLTPEHAAARQNLGIALRKLRRLDESLVQFDLLIAQAKKPTAAMYNGRHYTLCELGRRAEARADLEQAVALEPTFADAWNNLGIERKDAGDVDGAFAAFRRCIELAPGHAYAPRNEADLLLELGRAGEALAIYRRLAPSHLLTVTMALAQIETGDAAGARAALDARFADPAQPVEARMYVIRALAARVLGDHPGAQADLDALAGATNNIAWRAMTMFVADPLAIHRIAAGAVAPRAIAGALAAHGARAIGDGTVDDQLDCAELAIASALLAGELAFAAQRVHAAQATYVAQGPRFTRKWWPMLSTAVNVLARTLDADARAFLTRALRSLRGRHPMPGLA